MKVLLKLEVDDEKYGEWLRMGKHRDMVWKLHHPESLMETRGPLTPEGWAAAFQALLMDLGTVTVVASQERGE